MYMYFSLYAPSIHSKIFKNKLSYKVDEKRDVDIDSIRKGGGWGRRLEIGNLKNVGELWRGEGMEGGDLEKKKNKKKIGHRRKKKKKITAPRFLFPSLLPTSHTSLTSYLPFPSLPPQ